MANKELSFGYVKSEGIDGPCEAEVRRQIEQHDLELLWTRDVFMDYYGFASTNRYCLTLKGI